MTVSFYLLENLGQDMAASSHFYPYGSGVGDSIGMQEVWSSIATTSLSTSFILFGTSFNSLDVRTFV